VNAGGNDITVFAIGARAFTFVGKVSSGGTRPVSITASGRLICVLNAGSDSIAGFIETSDGRLFALLASACPLSGSNSGPAQIHFSPSGDRLLVTGKATNMIDVFDIGEFGYPGFPSVRPSVGEAPFGFAFGKRGQIFVSEAFGGAGGKGALSLVQPVRRPGTESREQVSA
jgi:6-phosphogluconolactonase